MDLLEKAIQYVNENYNSQIPHFERTLFWLLKLKPDEDEAMQIAAYGHDIQRGFSKDGNIDTVKESKEGFQNAQLLRVHQEDGAKIMAKFLAENGAQEELIEKVKHLISKHEEGGDSDQNFIKDADSISFFETNGEDFVTNFVPLVGKEKVRRKFDWMFDRISSDVARQYAKPDYEKLIKLLENN